MRQRAAASRVADSHERCEVHLKQQSPHRRPAAQGIPPSRSREASQSKQHPAARYCPSRRFLPSLPESPAEFSADAVWRIDRKDRPETTRNGNQTLTFAYSRRLKTGIGNFCHFINDRAPPANTSFNTQVEAFSLNCISACVRLFASADLTLFP